MTHLLFTVRFLDDRYHGLLDRGATPEWPPSPFRLFQALVAGVARRGELVVGDDVPSNTNFTPIGQALGWLQRRTRDHPPIIIAPKAKTGQAITRFVPNNDGDNPKKFDRQERLTAKPTIPTLFLLQPEQKPEVHYVWEIADTADCPIADIERAARSLTTLGWGIDMAFADAQLIDAIELNRRFELECKSADCSTDPKMRKWIVWYPKKDAGSFNDTLRTPTYDNDLCTLCDLRHCHSTFMNRIQHGQPLKTVDKPKVFDRVLYTSVERPQARPYAIFRLVDEDDEIIRPGHAHATLVHVAGQVRHAAITAVKDNLPSWSPNEPKWLETFVCGHRGAGELHQQISYVPLPSIWHTHADALIRNLMLVAPLGYERDLEFVASKINGVQLKPENEVQPIGIESPRRDRRSMFLERFTPPPRKFIAECYLGTSSVWHTVTPVILDGHNKRSKSDKPESIALETEKLICKALARAGIETPCTFTWQALPFLKNCLSAHKYDRDGRHTGYHRPAHLRDLTAVHVRLTFTHPVPGPITLGAGRHCGFGLFAAES